jgi:hypothetical protein
MDAYKRGKRARDKGKWINENPYIYGSNKWEEWRKGWLEEKSS